MTPLSFKWFRGDSQNFLVRQGLKRIMFIYRNKMVIITVELTERFTNGLLKLGLTADEVKNEFKYCGGGQGSGRHENYAIMCNIPEQKHREYCVCKQKIKHNCYIRRNEFILVLGSCCINAFCDAKGRRCEKCDEPHRNRIVNRCNDCRFGVCDDCGEECSPSYSRCGLCNYKKKIVIDVDDDICACGSKKNPAYPKCFACKFEIQDGSGICDCGKKIGLKYRKCFGCNQKDREQ